MSRNSRGLRDFSAASFGSYAEIGASQVIALRFASSPAVAGHSQPRRRMADVAFVASQPLHLFATPIAAILAADNSHGRLRAAEAARDT